MGEPYDERGFRVCARGRVSRPRRLLALAVYPERSAATRFRVRQYVPMLERAGWEVRFEPFMTDEMFRGFYAGRRVQNAVGLSLATLRRLRTAFFAGGYDAVFVQREAALIGPAYTEFILHSLKGIPIVFDFDDAIWHLDLPRSRHPIAARLLKSPGKCWRTMRQASLVLAGSEYLAGRARDVNSNVEVFPTVVPASTWAPRPGRLGGNEAEDRPLRIGWIGSHSTAHQLELAAPALRRLRDEGRRFTIQLVGAAPEFTLDGLDVEAVPWRLEEEVSRFQDLDIGLAPMHDGPVYEGKCGFKQLQYMAVGVPFVSSWVGGAKDFVVDGDNGLVAHDDDGWYRHLESLLESPDLRLSLARNGRTCIEEKYCLEKQGPRVAALVDEAFGHV